MVKKLLSKNIPVRFCEGQKEYFGKKVMSPHVDVFFMKKNHILHKQVYSTALYHCDQGTVDTLSIADIVLTRFLNDEPGVKIVCGKSVIISCQFLC